MQCISLVLATIGRIRELERFLQALDAQTYRDFELIVVDQNTDDRLVPILTEYQDRFPLTHLRCQPGLTRARNVGLKHIRGEIVAFPDDDCWYPPDLLERVATFWKAQPGWDGVIGRLVWDGEEVPRLSPAVRLVNPFNVTTSLHAETLFGAMMPKNPPVSVSSATLFLTRRSVEAVKGFDEELGLGSGTQWGGADEIDIILRCLNAGFKICFNPALKVYHPNPREKYADARKGFLYGAGMGRVLRKHEYPRWFVLYHWLRSLGIVVLSLVWGQWDKARYYWAVFRGKAAGWRSGRDNSKASKVG